MESPINVPRALKYAACLLVLLVVGGAIFHQLTRQIQTSQLGRQLRTEQAQQARRTELVRRADSAANFTAGRRYQLRQDAEILRQKDETHQATRPVTGPIYLPELPTR